MCMPNLASVLTMIRNCDVSRTRRMRSTNKGRKVNMKNELLYELKRYLIAHSSEMAAAMDQAVFLR